MFYQKNKFMHFQRHILGEGGKLKKSIPSPQKNRMRNQKIKFFLDEFWYIQSELKSNISCSLLNIIN